MELGKVRIGENEAWITVRHGVSLWKTIHIHGRVESVEEKGTNIEIRMKEVK